MQKGGKRVLITGGAGFIGRALAVHCLRQGSSVSVIDNLCVGSLPNLDDIASEVAFFQGDVQDVTCVKEVMDQSQPDILFHLAARHFIPYCNEHPRETMLVNVEGTRVVFSEAARHGTEVAVLASTGAFYPSQDCPLHEDLRAMPVEVYGLSKSLAEHVVQYSQIGKSMRCVAARLFNTYGPFETNPHLIPDIMKGLQTSTLLRLGNIDTKRDYIYVDDVADLLWRCAQNCRDPYTVVNVGTGIEYSARQIVDIISDIIGRNIEIMVDEGRMRAVDKLYQRADVRRLESLTGLRPRTSLAEGLTRLLKHERMSVSWKGQEI